MEFSNAVSFLEANHRAVVSTHGPVGGIQNSIVVAGPFQGKMGFVSVQGNTAKVRNLRRNPQCSVLTVDSDWRSYVIVEGQATLFDSGNTDAEELRLLRRAVYSASGGGEHPNWAEYDQVMGDQDAVVVLTSPDKVYGMIR